MIVQSDACFKEFIPAAGGVCIAAAHREGHCNDPGDSWWWQGERRAAARCLGEETARRTLVSGLATEGRGNGLPFTEPEMQFPGGI